MTARQLEAMLDGLDDTYEIICVTGHVDPEGGAALLLAWADAEDEAHARWQAWKAGGGGDAYAAYRAAADRADAAQDALARRFEERS